MNIRGKWLSTDNEAFKAVDHVWLIEDIDKRGYYNLGRDTETIDESDGVIRSAIIRTNDGVYQRPTLKLALVLPDRDYFAMKKRAGYVSVSLLIQQPN